MSYPVLQDKWTSQLYIEMSCPIPVSVHMPMSGITADIGNIYETLSACPNPESKQCRIK